MCEVCICMAGLNISLTVVTPLVWSIIFVCVSLEILVLSLEHHICVCITGSTCTVWVKIYILCVVMVVILICSTIKGAVARKRQII